MMKKAAFIIAVALILPLAACENKTETVTSEAADPQAEQLKKAAPIKLPPAMKASVVFRCKDNSLVYVDFFKGDTDANLRMEKSGPIIKLVAPKAGAPMVAEGYSVSGTPDAITLVQPGKSSLTCKR
jgi:hypothetical protein